MCEREGHTVYDTRMETSHQKQEKWTPVFKEEDREMEKNYSPITSLICIDKIFEQLLSKQITGHYDPNLYNKMTAYRKQHSCEATLLMLVEDWKLAVDRKMYHPCIIGLL